MSSAVFVACVLSLMMPVLIYSRPASGNVLTRKAEDVENQVEGRSPPIAMMVEPLLQSVLRTDQQKCSLRLVCTIGGNVTRFGTYGDMMSSYFGYIYNPFDFSVSENAHALEKLGRPAASLLSVESPTATKLPVTASTMDDGINNATDPELFNRKSTDGWKVPGFKSAELEGRSFFPAIKVFNQAFVMGLKGGRRSCDETFPDCTMDLDALIRMGINMFNNSNKNDSVSSPLKTVASN